MYILMSTIYLLITLYKAIDSATVKNKILILHYKFATNDNWCISVTFRDVKFEKVSHFLKYLGIANYGEVCE